MLNQRQQMGRRELCSRIVDGVPGGGVQSSFFRFAPSRGTIRHAAQVKAGGQICNNGYLMVGSSKFRSRFPVGCTLLQMQQMTPHQKQANLVGTLYSPL